MNEKKKTGIKPQRSKGAAEFSQRSIKVSGRMMMTYLVVLNLVVSLFLVFWIYSFSDNQTETGQNLIDKINIFETQLLNDSLSLKQNNEESQTKFKTIDKEIRKLWDLSNKKNKLAIVGLTENLNSMKESLDSVEKNLLAIQAKNRTRNLELKGLLNALDEINIKLAKLSSTQDITAIESQISDIELSIESIDSYRVQINNKFLELQSKIDRIQPKSGM